MKRGEKLTDERLEAILAQEIAASQVYDTSDLADKRREAIEYLDGILNKWPAEKGRSSVVDMTTLDTISWMLPSLLRLFSASDRMAIAEPTSREHEKWADQATVGINHAFWKENDGYQLLHDTTFDSLLHGDGIIKTWWDDTPKRTVSFHSGLSDMAYQDLLTPEDSGIDEDGYPKETINVLHHELCQYTLEPGDEGYDDYPDAQSPGVPGEAAGPLSPPSQGPAAPPQPQGPAALPQEPVPQAGPQGAPAGVSPMEGGNTAAQPGIAPQPSPGPPTGMPAGQAPMAMPQEPRVAMLHEVKIERLSRYGCIRMQTIPPEDFLISADAISLRKARMIGNKQQYTRSELIEMGFDYQKVMDTIQTQDDDAIESVRRNLNASDRASDQPLDNTAMEQVTLYELYLKIDVDGDGIAETIQAFFAGYGNVGTLLEWAEWEDEPVFWNIPCYPVPHRWNANGVFDRTKDIQEINTVLTRQALDNMYGSNNPQRFATGRIINPDELINPSFGGTVLGDTGATLVNLEVPFFAGHALEGLQWFQGVMERRTGVSRTTMALDPEALQNTTATANQLAHDAAYSQIELIARNQAELGWKYVFRAVLKLMVRHQKRKTTVRMTGKKWEDVDPRHWNADMDITINTGLGTGSRDRDIAVLSSVKTDQVALASILKEAHLPGRALEMVPMIVEALKKSGEAAGIRNIDEFYPEITPQDIQQAAADIQQSNGQPSPEIQVVQAQGQVQLQIEQAKAAAKAQVEQAQMQADLQVKQAEAAAKTQVEMAKSEAQIAREAAQLEADTRTARMKLDIELRMEEQRQMFEAQEKAKDRKLEFDLEIIKLKVQMQTAAKANHASANQARQTAGKPPVAEPPMEDPFAAINAGMVSADQVDSLIAKIKRMEQELLTQSDAMLTQTNASKAPRHIIRNANGQVDGVMNADGVPTHRVVRGRDGRVEGVLNADGVPTHRLVRGPDGRVQSVETMQ